MHPIRLLRGFPMFQTATAQMRTSFFRISVSEFCYYMFFLLMLGAKGLGLVEESFPYMLLLAAGMIFWLGKLILTEYSLTEKIWVTLLLFLTTIVYLRTGERGIVFCIAMLVGMKDISLRRIFHISSRFLMICFLLKMFLTQAGLLPDLYYVHAKGSLGYVVRWSFGYSHPNVLHITYLILAALWMYDLSDDRRKLQLASILFILGNLYVLFFSLSYTGFLVVTLYLACNYYLAVRSAAPLRHPLLRKCINFCAELIFPACVLFSVAGPVLLKGKAYELADKLVHHRFVLSNYFLTTEPVCLLGHRLLTTPDLNNSMDCSYVYLFVHLGVLFFVLFCVFYFAAIHSALRKKHGAEAAILISFAIAGVTEPFMFNTSFKNITCLILGNFLFQLKMPSCLPYTFRKHAHVNHLTALGQRNLSFPRPSMKSFGLHAAPARVLRRICLGSCIPAFLLTLFFVFRTAPFSTVLIPARFCPDGSEQSPVVYTEQMISALSSDTLVLSWSAPEEMCVYTGITPHLEYIRRAVCTFTWGWLVSCLLLFLFIQARSRSTKTEDQTTHRNDPDRSSP